MLVKYLKMNVKWVLCQTTSVQKRKKENIAQYVCIFVYFQVTFKWLQIFL